MKKDELYSTILGCSVSGFYKWKKQNRLIISLLEKYFTKEDLEEFLERGEIVKQELVKDFNKEEVKRLLKDYHNEKILEKIEYLKKQLVE